MAVPACNTLASTCAVKKAFDAVLVSVKVSKRQAQKRGDTGIVSLDAEEDGWIESLRSAKDLLADYNDNARNNTRRSGKRRRLTTLVSGDLCRAAVVAAVSIADNISCDTYMDIAGTLERPGATSHGGRQVFRQAVNLVWGQDASYTTEPDEWDCLEDDHAAYERQRRGETRECNVQYGHCFCADGRCKRSRMPELRAQVQHNHERCKEEELQKQLAYAAAQAPSEPRELFWPIGSPKHRSGRQKKHRKRKHKVASASDSANTSTSALNEDIKRLQFQMPTTLHTTPVQSTQMTQCDHDDAVTSSDESSRSCSSPICLSPSSFASPPMASRQHSGGASSTSDSPLMPWMLAIASCLSPFATAASPEQKYSAGECHDCMHSNGLFSRNWRTGLATH